MAKIQFDRETLLSRLKLLASIIPKKPVLGAHEQFRFNIVAGSASVTSTDGSKQITVTCDTTKCDGDIMFTIPGKLLVSTLGLLMDSEVKLDVKETQVVLKCGRSTYKLASENGRSYPMMPEIKSNFEASFAGAIFNEAMQTANKYTNSESSVVAQQGVNLHFDDGKVNAYGFKGNEFCKIVIKPRSVNSWDDILIPTATVKTMVGCVNDSDIVDVFHDNERIEIRTSSVSIIAVTHDIKYPDVEHFYKKRPDTCAKYNTVQFLKALERLQPYASEESPLLVIDIKTASTVMTVDNAAYSMDGVEEIDAIAPLECRIGMNVNFMINALRSFTNDEFFIFYSEPNKPLFIEPSNIAKDNDKFILLAPMSLSN